MIKRTIETVRIYMCISIHNNLQYDFFPVNFQDVKDYVKIFKSVLNCREDIIKTKEVIRKKEKRCFIKKRTKRFFL